MGDEKRPPPDPPWGKTPRAPAKTVTRPPGAPPKRSDLLDRPTQFMGAPAKPSQETVPLVPSPNPYLVITAGPRKGEEIVLREELDFGRDAGAQVVVADEAASRRHARIYRKEGRWYLRDQGSTNGTHHQDGLLRGSERILHDRDAFRIGEWEFVFSDPIHPRR